MTMNTASIVNGRSHQRRLNFDILVYVGHCIKERKDLLSFISTCSDLYRTGVPALLGFHYCITKENVAAFHEFLVSKSPSSFMGLRSLELYFPEQHVRHNRIGTVIKTGPTEISIVTDILIRAKKIRNIEIYGNLMESDPTVYRALAALPALEVLNLSGCSDPKGEILAALAQLHSPLLSIDLKFHGEDEDIVATLSNFCHTLSRLAVSDIALPKAAPSDFCYSNLTYLKIASVPNMRLSILVSAFPNLEHLVVKFADDFPDDLGTMREDNLRFQQEHPNQMWRLSSLTGDASSLYVLGLQTAVHRVAITCVGIRMHEEAPGLLDLILMPLRPLYLSMVSVDEFDDDIFEMGWLSNEITYEGCQFRRLDLELTFESGKLDHELQARLVSSARFFCLDKLDVSTSRTLCSNSLPWYLFQIQLL